MTNPYEPYSSGQQPQQPADPAAPTQFVPLQQPQQPPVYGAPQDAPAWGQPAGQAPYGAPPQQPVPPAYGQQPQVPAFGQQPQVPAFGQPPQQPGQPAFGQGPYGYPTAVSPVKANRTGGARIAGAIFGSILGRVLVAVVVIGGIVGYHFATDNPAKRDSSGNVSQAGTLSVLDLKVGDCFNSPSADSDIESVTAVPCTQAHDSQVYAEPKISESSYPGTATLKTEGQTACNTDDALAGVSSDVPSDIGVDIFFPEDADTFDAGTDFFSCALNSTSKDLTQSFVTGS
jgi:hypothetical protein